MKPQKKYSRTPLQGYNELAQAEMESKLSIKKMLEKNVPPEEDEAEDLNKNSRRGSFLRLKDLLIRKASSASFQEDKALKSNYEAYSSSKSEPANEHIYEEISETLSGLKLIRRAIDKNTEKRLKAIKDNLDASSNRR